jgi:3',5'-cyclic AMP phosphodiesterase CpdA
LISVEWEEFFMATLLHLSDLHLGEEVDEALGDYKLEVIAQHERQTRSAALRSTLEQLGEALRSEGESIDAVIISGDVTYQGSQSGFAKLGDMLGCLGESLPDASSIMIVPGNHDVAWGTEPGSKERYEQFVKGIRANSKYVTPMLEGIDIDNQRHMITNEQSPVLAASDGSFVVVGLNSSDHCGVQQQIDAGLASAIKSVNENDDDQAAKSLLHAWEQSRLYDVLRVSDGQRSVARKALTESIAPGSDPVRIAVFHHQLLPMSLEEEIKPFESIVNLAQVRDWLAHNNIDVVLHGHKHVARTYVDHYTALDDNTVERKVVVSSVGTIGQGQGARGVVGKLITIDTSRQSLGKITIREVV